MGLDSRTPAVKRQESKHLHRLQVRFCHTKCTRALYQERGLLTAGGKDIKNKEEILTLLDAVWEPEKVVVIHCRGHQKEDTLQVRGNRLAKRLLNKKLRAWG